MRTGLFRPMAELETLNAALQRRSLLSGGVRIDPAREWWRLFGAALAILAGASMLAASPAAPGMLTVLVLHNILFFARQEDESLKGAQVGREVSRRMALGYVLTTLAAVYAAGLVGFGALA